MVAALRSVPRVLVESSRTTAEEVRAQYLRFVAFHSDYADVEADTLTLWTMHTHAFAAVEKTPYILITAPTPEAGKSRIMDVARHLVRAPFPVVDPSAASLYRAIEVWQPTLLIDEVDTLRQSKALQGVLNSGFEVGLYVTRSTGKPGPAGIERLSTFCPKMFVGISGRTPPIKNATLTRCIVIPMRRRLASETIARFYHRDTAELTALHDLLAEWAVDAVPTLAVAAPKRVDTLSDRQSDAWEPLFAIADSLGGTWPKRARAAAVTLSGVLAARPDPGTQLIHDMREAWATLPLTVTRAHTSVLADIRNGLPDRQYAETLNGHELSQRLASFGIHPEPNGFRVNGVLARGYTRASFADAFERYR